MSDFVVRIDDSQLEAFIKNASRQVRVAASVGLNRTMDEAQTAIQSGLAGRFTLRRAEFIKRTVYRKPKEDFASADKLIAGVRINEDRNFLAKFEDGGSKRPTDGGFLGIPIAARPTKESIVPERFRLKQLFLGQRSTLQQLGTIAKLNMAGKRGKVKIAKKRIALGGSDIFVKDGKVWQVGNKAHSKMNLLYVFKRAVWIRPTLRFVETAKGVINARAKANIEGAIAIELSRGLNLTGKAK